MKRRDEILDLRGQSVEELTKKLADERKHLLELTFAHALHKLKNIHLLKKSRQMIARLETILREKVALRLQKTAEKES